MTILEQLQAKRANKQKSFAVLLDPDKLSLSAFQKIIRLGMECKVDYFFIGGSLLAGDDLHELVMEIKNSTSIPVVLFPGNNLQINPNADAILFLSLISGRNPEYLIGQQVVAAPILRNTRLEVMPTGYMLVDCGKQTTVSYISNTTPIPYDKPSVAACTAMAGEMLGLKLIFLDGGSGSQKPISRKMIATIRKVVEVPIIVGGGINSPGKAVDAWLSGADVVVIGNGIERDLQLLIEVADKARELNAAAASDIH